MTVKSLTDILTRVGGNFIRTEPLYGEVQAGTTSLLFGSGSMTVRRCAYTAAIDNPLPAGVTAFLPMTIGIVSSQSTTVLVARQTKLGSLDMTSGSGTFIAGSDMPTATVGNTAGVQTYSGILVELTGATLGAGPGTLTVTYTNQSGTAGQSTGAQGFAISAKFNTAGYIPLASGDVGAIHVAGATITVNSPSTLGFYGLLPVALITGGIGNNVGVVNFLTGQPFAPRLSAGEQLAFFSVGSFASTAAAVSGAIRYVGDS